MSRVMSSKTKMKPLREDDDDDNVASLLREHEDDNDAAVPLSLNYYPPTLHSVMLSCSSCTISLVSSYESSLLLSHSPAIA